MYLASRNSVTGRLSRRIALKKNWVSSWKALRRLASNSGKTSGRADLIETAEEEPLAREVADERFGFAVFEHAGELLIEDFLVFQLALVGQGEQFIVRDAGPEEEGQARGKFVVVHAMHGTGGAAPGSRSMRKRKSGATSMARRAISMPLLKSFSLRPVA